MAKKNDDRNFNIGLGIFFAFVFGILMTMSSVVINFFPTNFIGNVIIGAAIYYLIVKFIWKE